MELNVQDYDFLDFGASKGGSIALGQKLFGAERGLGIDIDPDKVELMRRGGFDCLEGDITRLDVPAEAVRFVVISHLLEHLPSLQAVEATLRSAARVASDFIYIQGPFFDEDAYLARHGFKLYWSDWTGHTCHLTTGQLVEILDRLGLNDYVMMLRDRFRDSGHSAVHPWSSPRNQHAYDPGKHPPKETLTFDRDLYSEMVCCVALKPLSGWGRLVRRVGRWKKAEVLSDPVGPSEEQTRLAKIQTSPRSREVHKRLLIDGKWDFLSYLHLRDAVMEMAGVRRVLCLNMRRGYQEIALACEFPDIRFQLALAPGSSPVRYAKVQHLIDAWSLPNVELGTSKEGDFDLVAVSGMLNGSQNDENVLAFLEDQGSRYLWLLAPYYEAGSTRGRFRGYSPAEVAARFSGKLRFRGCIWDGAGTYLSEELAALGSEEVVAQQGRLTALAAEDLVDAEPKPGQCLGFWMSADRG